MPLEKPRSSPIVFPHLKAETLSPVMVRNFSGSDPFLSYPQEVVVDNQTRAALKRCGVKRDNRLPGFMADIRRHLPKATEDEIEAFFDAEVLEFRRNYGAASDDDISRMAERYVREHRGRKSR